MAMKVKITLLYNLHFQNRTSYTSILTFVTSARYQEGSFRTQCKQLYGPVDGLLIYCYCF